MKVFLHQFANMGDFCNTLPVVSGISKYYNQPLTLIIESRLRRFNGFKEFLALNSIFESVIFADDYTRSQGSSNDVLVISSWPWCEHKAPRPRDTSRAENCVRERYNLDFEVDDKFTLAVPDNIDFDFDPNQVYVGDRTVDASGYDPRRAGMGVPNLTNCKYLDFNDTVSRNAFLIANSTKPFVSCFTGISILADLLNKDNIVSWKAEDFSPMNRTLDGKEICWDEGINSQGVFEKHYYTNRKSRLVHYNNVQFEIDKAQDA